MTILNLTQYQATPEQLKAGVVDLPDDQRQQLAGLLIFLEGALNVAGIAPVYAFTLHCKGFERQPDGSVCSVDVFRHLGWVEA